MKSVNQLAGLAVTVAVVLAGSQLHAQTATVNKSPVASEAPEPEVIKIYDENTLTPDNIRTCLTTDRDIADMEKKLAEYEITLENFKKEISALTDDMDKRRKQIDGTDPKAVDAYNARVDRHRAMIDRYNQKFLPTLAERRARMNKSIDFYNQNCADKAYFEDDWVAIVEELGIEDPRPQAGGGK
ncbi:hypothetical protein [Minwuia sp.]|uniref:hypothetical protein n=1 Tax=Minwuia sp. TaxID=2493630 RepID=UPI003A925773